MCHSNCRACSKTENKMEQLTRKYIIMLPTFSKIIQACHFSTNSVYLWQMIVHTKLTFLILFLTQDINALL